MSTQKAQRQPLSDKRKLIIIITAIVLAAVIAVSATLIVLLQPKDVTPDKNDPSNNPSSSLPVKNGDFGIVGSEDTTFPKSATNWTRYTYKAPNGSSHDLEAIESAENVVMGIVDTDDEQWDTVVSQVTSELTASGADASKYNLTNPKQHQFLSENEKHSNSNVYMIATVNPTSAAILSDSVSVSATTSVKITIRYNASQISEGEAVVMIQNHSSTPNAKEENRYAYDYHITQKDDWHEISLYVFNRKTSTQYVRVSVGLGNVYTGDNASGVLYVDDITYETVTANEYRLYADKATDGDTTYKIIEKEEATTVPAESKYLQLKDLDANVVRPVDFTRSEDHEGEKGYVNATITADDPNGYSPFTDKDDFFKTEGEGDDARLVPTGFGIYKLENNGDNKKPVAMELFQTLELKLDEKDFTVQDYNHVSFWVRTVSKNDNALAYANILVQRKTASGEWESLTNGDFTTKTEQNIKTDTNNGWSKYDIYLKPAKTPTEIRIVFALGSINGYEGTDYAPDGELYITTPYFETISSSAYTSASSATASKKFDLTGSTADTSVTNGSFSSVSANTQQPTGWTPAFAGQNIIYRDGKGDLTVGNDLSKDRAAVEGSGTVNWRDEFTSDADKNYVDDDEGKILKLVNNKDYKSSYGYVSSEITASAKTVYAFSVLAKVGNGSTTARPYFYLLKTNVDRDEAILAEVNNFYEKTPDNLLFCQGDDIIYKGTGWTRYYIIYVTGEEDTSVRLALFNGSIDGTQPAVDDTTIYYDKVTMQTLGTYSLVKDEDNKDATEYIVKFAAGTAFADNAIGECEDIEQLVKKMEEVLNTDASKASSSISNPSDEEWTEMKKIPEPEENKDNETPTTPSQKTDVNLALLFSILSSVLLVAALAVVIVIKIFRQRKRLS